MKIILRHAALRLDVSVQVRISVQNYTQYVKLYTVCKITHCTGIVGKKRDHGILDPMIRRNKRLGEIKEIRKNIL